MQRAGIFIAGRLVAGQPGESAPRWGALRIRRLAASMAGVLAVLLGALTPAAAVPVTSLYVVMVPAADADAAAQEAMRVELVRLTGRRSAASDPALAALIDNAHQYVQLERATISGQLQVLFDEPALAAAIAATGVTLWGTDRPLLWVWLPPLDAATDQAMRARLAEAAEERGLPITIAAAAPAAAAVAPTPASAAPAAPAAVPVAPPGAASAQGPAAAAAAPPRAASTALAAPAPAQAQAQARAAAGAAGSAAAAGAAAPGSTPAASAPAGSPAPLPPPLTPALALNAAHAAGASAALVATPAASQPGSLQWTLSSPEGGGQWVGGPELAIDQAADTLAAAALAIDRSPLTQYVCHISGVADLPGLVSVLDVVHAAPGVSQVDLSDVDGDQLTLQLAARGTGPDLERALAGDRLQPTGTGTEGLLEYRYVAAR